MNQPPGEDAIGLIKYLCYRTPNQGAFQSVMQEADCKTTLPATVRNVNAGGVRGRIDLSRPLSSNEVKGCDLGGHVRRDVLASIDCPPTACVGSVSLILSTPDGPGMGR
jgi:hypothetical protein